VLAPGERDAHTAAGFPVDLRSAQQSDVGRRSFQDRRDVVGEGVRIEIGRVEEDEPDVVRRGQAYRVGDRIERGERRSPNLGAE